MSKSKIASPFKGASTERPQKQDDYRYFYLFLSALLDPGKYSDRAEFDNLVKEIYGTPEERGDDQKDIISGIRDFFTTADDSMPEPEDAAPQETTADNTARRYVTPRFQASTYPPQKSGIGETLHKYSGGLNMQSGPTVLDPALVDAMQKNKNIREYATFAMDLGKQYGLDGNMLANQFWTESKFNPDAHSGAGAKGIAQFIPATAADYGLAGKEYNPYESMMAGARYMSDLTKKFGNDQRLALIAYNGGGGAISYVQKTLGKEITINDWMSHMAKQREELGIGPMNLWRHQTFDYIRQIDSGFWDANKRDTGLEKMAATGFTSGPVKTAHNSPEITTTMGG